MKWGMAVLLWILTKRKPRIVRMQTAFHFVAYPLMVDLA